MTTEKLTEIKAAAEKIHAAAVAAGRWKNKPEWEDKLMDIVCDISRAVEAEKADRHADLYFFGVDGKKPKDERGSFETWIFGTVEDCLADAVIDILDTVEGFCPEWERYEGPDTEGTLTSDDARIMGTIEEFALHTVGEISFFECCQEDPGWQVVQIMEDLKHYTEAHGIDLRRHVELKMKYNEIRR